MNKISVKERSIWIWNPKVWICWYRRSTKFNKYDVRDLEIAGDKHVCKHDRLAKYFSWKWVRVVTEEKTSQFKIWSSTLK